MAGDDPDALLKLGLSRARAGALDDAIDLWRKAVLAAPRLFNA